MNLATLIHACLWTLIIVASAFGQQSSSPATKHLMEFAIRTENSGKAWTFTPADYQQEIRQLPIGVFDSGIGGLTVLEAILSLDAFDNDTLAPAPDGRPDFEDERFVYLGDQANMPYGNYAAEGQLEYLRELILKDALFLLGKRFWPHQDSPHPVFTKPPVKAIAIGCNTATAYGLEDIQEALKRWNIPVFVVGVVEAGARGVLELQRQAKAGYQEQSVAVFATAGTCSSGAYPKAIGRALGLAGRRVPSILQQASTDLPAAIEGDPAVLSGSTLDQIIRRDLEELIESHRQSGSLHPIGTMVLGCTHFPLVQDKILETLTELKETQIDGQRPYDSLIADHVKIVNPADLTARELFRSLARNRLRAAPRSGEAADTRSDLYFISVPNPGCPNVQLASDGGLTKSYKYGRHTQQLEIEDTLVVPMLLDQLSPSSVNLIRSSLPNVWKGMNAAAHQRLLD